MNANGTTRGFTLVELIVVVGMIVLLTGLTVSVGTRVVERAEIRTTENILRLLDTAVQEWEAQSDRKLTWGEDGVPANAVYDLQGSLTESLTSDVMVITEVLAPLRRVDSVMSILAGIGPDHLYEYDGSNYADWIDTPQEESDLENRFFGELTVVDAWGTPIYATHPGRVATAADRADPEIVIDPDGTVRTYNERVYGVAVSRRVCFVSAGPDGEFGELFIEGQRDAAADNVYSYPVIMPEEE